MNVLTRNYKINMIEILIVSQYLFFPCTMKNTGDLANPSKRLPSPPLADLSGWLLWRQSALGWWWLVYMICRWVVQFKYNHVSSRVLLNRTYSNRNICMIYSYICFIHFIAIKVVLATVSFYFVLRMKY